VALGPGWAAGGVFGNENVSGQDISAVVDSNDMVWTALQTVDAGGTAIGTLIKLGFQNILSGTAIDAIVNSWSVQEGGRRDDDRHVILVVAEAGESRDRHSRRQDPGRCCGASSVAVGLPR
jgi:autotransporter passenger strand-loop-strand repeat protein